MLLDATRGARRQLIVTDSVFSMDGDLAPLAEIVELARHYGAAVIVDEAHGLGVIGHGGAGLAAALGLTRGIERHIGTLSKSLGAYGAYVAGSSILIDYLVNQARSFIYSTGDVEGAVNKAVQTYGRIDCAFNNAGIEGKGGNTHECTQENW